MISTALICIHFLIFLLCADTNYKFHILIIILESEYSFKIEDDQWESANLIKKKEKKNTRENDRMLMTLTPTPHHHHEELEIVGLG